MNGNRGRKNKDYFEIGSSYIEGIKNCLQRSYKLLPSNCDGVENVLHKNVYVLIEKVGTKRLIQQSIHKYILIE
jgi:hypothetical protein